MEPGIGAGGSSGPPVGQGVERVGIWVLPRSRNANTSQVKVENLIRLELLVPGDSVDGRHAQG